MTDHPPPRLRRLRFALRLSTRALMASVLVLGVILGWLAYRARTQRLAVLAIEAAGGHVQYERDGAPSGARSSWPNWLVDSLGPDYFSHVVGVDFARDADDSVMALVGRLGRIEDLRFSGVSKMTDPGLVHLSGLSRLRWLELGYTPITDAGLANLAGLRSLEGLVIYSSTRLTDKGLTHLEGLTNLHRLALHSGPITSEGLRHLRGMKRLRSLGLFGTRVDDLSPLADLPELSSLMLNGTRIDDAGVAAVTGFPKLGSLSLDDTPIGDAGLAHLSGSKYLYHLSLARTRITDAGLSHLAGLPACDRMSLSGTKVTPAGIASLKAGIPRLNMDDGPTPAP